jgi:diguanylate cyclase (GGDEF)-like protein
MLTPRFKPSAFDDTQDAPKPRSRLNLRFGPTLEAEYARAHLNNSRTLILVACVVATLLAILRGAEQMVRNGSSSIDPITLAIVITSSLALTAIASSTTFERLYLPWARLVVPIRNVIVAAHIATAASLGQLELLMIMPIALIGPFFFLGFNFHMGLLCGVLTTGSFIVSALFLDLGPTITLRTCVFLLLNLVACTIIARHFDKLSRTAFVETRVNADLAQHDALTGMKNRRVFDEHLVSLWPKAIEDRRAIAVLLVDVDHFKSYNDHYGHQAGDQTLRRVAQAIQTFACRPLDVLARYGGEEFAAVIYDVDEQRAMQVAERMRCAVEELNISHQGSRTFGRVTISVGVAAVKPTRDRNVQGVLQLADQALYEAKASGRNRIKTMSEVEHRMLETGVFSQTRHASTPDKKLA